MSATIEQRLAEARDEVARLEGLQKTGDCAALGHDMKHVGGCNAGCGRDCGCSVPVYQCTRCPECDYGDNEEADEKRASCAALREFDEQEEVDPSQSSTDQSTERNGDDK